MCELVGETGRTRSYWRLCPRKVTLKLNLVLRGKLNGDKTVPGTQSSHLKSQSIFAYLPLQSADQHSWLEAELSVLT